MNIKTIIKRVIGIAVLANVLPVAVKFIAHTEWKETYMIYGTALAIILGLIGSFVLLTHLLVWCFDK